MGDYVLVEANGSKGKELYNLREDLGQTKNLAADQPERVRQLQAAWDAWDRGNVPRRVAPGKDKEKKKAGKE